MNNFVFLRSMAALAVVSMFSFFAPIAAQATEAGTSLTVNVSVTNDHGGTVAVGDVAIFIDAGAVTSGAVNPMSPGAYTVTASTPSGYTVVIGGDCDYLGSVSLAEFENKSCSVTLDDIAPQLTVIKTVINDDDGEYSAQDFSMEVNGTDVSNETFSGSSEGTTVTLDAGSYSVDESDYLVESESEHGYTKSIGEGCAGTIAIGETRTCTITNDDPTPVPTRGTLIVKKHVINDNGGTNVAGDFTLYVHEEERYTFNLFQFAVVREDGIRVTGSEEGERVALYPGEYSVTESDYVRGSEAPHNYTVSFSEGCSGTIVAGQTITCTVTNSDPGSPSPSSGGGGHILIDQAPLGGGSAPAPNASAPTPAPAPEPASTTAVPRVLGDMDTDSSVLTCRNNEPESMIVTSGLEEILRALNQTRSTQAEQVGASVLAKVVTGDAALNHFVSYGTLGTQHLGAGERAGVIDSYRRVYGRVPRTECDWQDALRIAKGLLPITRVEAREVEAESTFEVIYKRAATVQENDVKTVWMMAYGLRPKERNLAVERQAARIFRSLLARDPQTSGDWDTTRAIAYGGVPVPGFAIVGE